MQVKRKCQWWVVRTVVSKFITTHVKKIIFWHLWTLKQFHLHLLSTSGHQSSMHSNWTFKYTFCMTLLEQWYLMHVINEQPYFLAFFARYCYINHSWMHSCCTTRFSTLEKKQWNYAARLIHLVDIEIMIRFFPSYNNPRLNGQ